LRVIIISLIFITEGKNADFFPALTGTLVL